MKNDLYCILKNNQRLGIREIMQHFISVTFTLLNYLASIDKISKLRNCVSQSMITKISIWIRECVSFIWNVRVHGWVPSLQIKFCLYVNTITKGNSSVGRSKTELQQKCVPVYYWWNILNIVPTRPKETNNFHVIQSPTSEQDMINDNAKPLKYTKFQSILG